MKAAQFLKEDSSSVYSIDQHNIAFIAESLVGYESSNSFSIADDSSLGLSKISCYNFDCQENKERIDQGRPSISNMSVWGPANDNKINEKEINFASFRKSIRTNPPLMSESISESDKEIEILSKCSKKRKCEIGNIVTVQIEHKISKAKRREKNRDRNNVPENESDYENLKEMVEQINGYRTF